MDRTLTVDTLLKRFDAVKDSDLAIVEHRGVAYQRDMKRGRVNYDADYWRKVSAYEDSEIARAVNAGRCALVARHLEVGSSVLDIGAGTGAFVRAARSAGFNARGYDVMKRAADFLMRAGHWSHDPYDFDAVSFWDSLEHMDMPETWLKAVRKGARLFISVPIFDDLRCVRASKHYRPGEHLYYFTRDGLVNWLALWGFRLLEESTHEIDAGREAIGAFAFVRDLPDYHDHVALYADMHSTRYYGGSSTELHLDTVAAIVREMRPRSIIDYGCGRSDLVAHFWADGERRIARFDPAIPAHKELPVGPFDLALVCDVMEHVPMAGVDVVLSQARKLSARALFTISTKPARAKLPDGRNAHVTLLRDQEWVRWIADYWGGARVVPSRWEHELIVVAGAKER